jgi:hypothetical protein
LNKLNTLILLIIATLFCSQVAVSDEASKAEAEALLETIDMPQILKQSITQMLDLQLQQNPAMAPYKHVMLEFLSKYMSYENLKPQMLEMYANAFTAAELKDINAFYNTQTGKKTLTIMPQLMAQGGQLGAQTVKDNIEELQQMIKAEATRIRSLQEQ